MAGMKILFIGGTGNISAECAALLHERGYEVLVLSRGQMAVPPEYRAIRADRKDLAAMRAALAGVRPDVVLNFLGYDVPEVQIDYELFQGAVRQYVFISSTVVYAKPPRQLPTDGSRAVRQPVVGLRGEEAGVRAMARGAPEGNRLPGDDCPPFAHLLQAVGSERRSPAGATPLRRGWSRANRCLCTTLAKVPGH